MYPNHTEHHDHYVVSFFNTYFASTSGQVDNAPFNHTFVVGEWDDFGAAQWGGKLTFINTYILHTFIQTYIKNIHLFLFIGGFITYAMEGVRSTNLIVYDGMVKHIHIHIHIHIIYIHTYGTLLKVTYYTNIGILHTVALWHSGLL